MRRPSRAGLVWAMAICIVQPIAAQNLEAIGKEKPFSFSGGISFNQIYYTSHGITARRTPYSFVASGNTNVSLYGWNIPLSFTLSSRSSTFTQPFNQYAVHPRWKWITLHAGYTSMTLSPYTVNGHVFRGVALDLEPGSRWHFSALYGRFKKAVKGGATSQDTPAFRRPGYALKARYGDGNDFIEAIAFHAHDDQNSIAWPHDSLSILPQQNLVASGGVSKTIARRLVLKGEIAASVLTRDTRAEKTASHPLGKVLSFLPTTASTSCYQAMKASLDYQREGWTIGAGYERIDPGYETLGAYYFNNDMRNITVNTTARALKEKLTIAASTGIQEDNVDDSKMTTMRRMVSSCNIGYAPSPKTNISVSWSTFQTYSNIRSHFEALDDLTPYDRMDTLNFRQIAKSAALNAMFTPGSRQDKRQSLNLNASWQESADSQGTAPVGSVFLNVSGGYTLSFPQRNLAVSLVYVTSVSRSTNVETRTMGPTTSVTQSHFNRKLRTTVSASWNTTSSNDLKTSSTINSRLNIAASVFRNHQLSISAVFVNRQAPERQTRSSELTATVSYLYSIGQLNN